MSAQRILVQEAEDLMVQFENTLNYSFSRQQLFRLIFKTLELKTNFIPNCISCMATFDLIEAHLRECLGSLLVRLRLPLQSQEQLLKAEELLDQYDIIETKQSIEVNIENDMAVEMATKSTTLERCIERKQIVQSSQENNDLQYENDNHISLLSPKQAAPLDKSQYQDISYDNYQQLKKSSFDCSSPNSHQDNSSLCTTESSIGITELIDEKQHDYQNINTSNIICQDCQFVRNKINNKFCRVLINLRIAANLRELGYIDANLLCLKNIFIHIRDGSFKAIEKTHLEILLYLEYGLIYLVIQEDELAEKCLLKGLSLVRSFQRNLQRKQTKYWLNQESAKNLEDHIREQLAETLFRKGQLLNAEKLIALVIESKLNRFDQFHYCTLSSKLLKVKILEQISSNPADVLEEIKSFKHVQASNQDIKGITGCECALLTCRIQLKRIRMQKEDNFQNNEAQQIECIVNLQESIEELKFFCGDRSYTVLAAEVNSLGKTLQNLKLYEQALQVYSDALAGMPFERYCYENNNLLKENLEIALNSAAQCAQKLMRFKQAHDLYQRLLQITQMAQLNMTIYDPTEDKDIHRFAIFSPEIITKEQEIIRLIKQTTTED